MKAIKKIKVLIVDDSLLFREALSKALESDPYLDIIGTAVDSFDAMEKIKAQNPDVVTLDVEMPKVSGIEFLKQLMPVHPLPVVVVSSLPINTLDALDAGAVDFVQKPTVKSSDDMNRFISELKIKIKIASSANVRKNSINVNHITPELTACSDDMIIAIGASTGGTEAVLSVIKDLPSATPAILVVLHMPPVFTKMYAERLDRVCKMAVKEAQDRERVEKGTVYIAPGDYHMTLEKDSKGFYIRCQQGQKVSGHRPSVDVLFGSVAEIAKNKAIGIILTGMGSDGSKGLLKMRKSGAYTIGQGKESCIVYGMPMAAYNINAVQSQLPLNKIKKSIIDYLNKHMKQ